MKRIASALAFVAVVAFAPLPSMAQNAQTLADVRQELNVLFVEIQKLKRELSTTGGASVPPAGGSVLDRVAAMESQLQRLTAKTEELQFRVERVVQDGTNRIGDLEFRLVELEGGDISQLGETTTLGGPLAAEGGEGQGAPMESLTPQDTGDGPQLAMAEQADFDAAQAALEAGNAAEAAQRFQAFVTAYPGGPLTDQAALLRGEALLAAGEPAAAARAYLDLFSSAPNGKVAPQALLGVGTTLGQLGQTSEACVTLAEVPARFPGSPSAAEAQSARQSLGCQ